MAKYDVEFSCGHTEERQLSGPQVGRCRAIERMKGETCGACNAKALAERGQAAAQWAKEMDLPNLQGSEKQVLWANRLRYSALMASCRVLGGDFTIFEAMDRAREDGEPDARRDEALAKLEALLRTDSAAWWIDNRVADTWISLARRV